MPEPQNSNTPVLEDDGVSREDLFRRATFHWALSTKKMVESSAALGGNKSVSAAALADIEYARDLLDKLYVPRTVKGSVTSIPSDKVLITAAEVMESVSSLIGRVVAMPPPQVRKTPFNAKVERSQNHRGADLSAPVESKNGKMLWAGVDCPVCPSKASQRCQKDDGGFIEKPHTPRKALAEQSHNT